MTIQDSINKLEAYVIREEYKGYDPYDTLNSFFPFRKFGKWPPVLALQFQKRNPLNIRPILGVKKEINPKAYGLFLQAYTLLYENTKNETYRRKADFFFEWLNQNYTSGYSGKCWGYNFPWASSSKFLEKFVPSAVVTGFVGKGLFEYYRVTKKKEAADLLESACLFLDKDLEKVADQSGISISYTPVEKDICYNASLLAAEVLAKTSRINGDQDYKNKAIQAVNFVVSKIKPDGRWNYSIDLDFSKEDTQIDFHQGYVLESIFEIKKTLNMDDQKWENALKKGVDFYFKEQFHESGRSYWRLPKKYPVEIHNQSQGIITFTKLAEYNAEAAHFANTIAQWTIEHMQGNDGHFYYQVLKTHKHKIPYMRWSQAWMFLALTILNTRSKK